VLFLISDDLNCRIGCYGDSIAKTPNLDRLAKMGVRFDRAYCQQPLCNPTRTSVLTGQYPTSTRVFDNLTYLVLEDGQQILPRYFQSQGYAAAEFGKVWHGPNDGTPKKIKAKKGTGVVWSTPDERAEQEKTQPDYWTKNHTPYRNNPLTPGTYTKANEFGPLPPGVTEDDTRIATDAIAQLAKFAQDKSKPFFLSVGFHKPHVPLQCPQEFFDLYDAASLPLPPDFATAPTIPSGTPPDELRQNIDLFEGKTFTAAEARAALQAYYACVSYMDAQLGRVLDALEKNGLSENTIIVFWGDHGWHLSDRGMWGKGTLFENTTRGPLLIADPRQNTAGQTSSRIVEYLSLFPTLTELCGLPPPAWLQGVSLVPLLKKPQAEWTRPALSVQPRGWFMGRSIRTERWRYTEWDGGRRGNELYDHDHDALEQHNLAADPAYKETVAALQKELRASKVSHP
jgi:arylsulfatase A-like enzyme